MLALGQKIGLLILVSVSLVGLTAFRALETEHPLPRASVGQSDGWIDEQVCADCHFEQTELFSLTGHARTLHRANSEESRELLRKMGESVAGRDDALSVNSIGERITIEHRMGDVSRRLNLDWCFGSGEHARTWIGMLPDSWGERDLIEFRWSWFHELNDFDLTPGQPKVKGADYYAALGVLFDAPKARRCFSCHSTVLPQESGHTEFNEVHPGVTCQRCHGTRKSHVESQGEIQEGFWRTASQKESINRCGECHRIAEDQDPEKIDPANAEIVRFQPVGLSQSPCFRGSQELTCLTCHDPHRPLRDQDSTGLWQCAQCHDGTERNHALCSAGHRDDCLTCHMPKVRTFDAIDFTDHWIRIRETSLPASP